MIKQTFFNIFLSLIKKYSRRPLIRLPSPAPNSITDNLSSQIDLLFTCINHSQICFDNKNAKSSDIEGEVTKSPLEPKLALPLP